MSLHTVALRGSVWPVRRPTFDHVDFPLFLGGALRPIGCSISFVDRSLEETLAAVEEIHAQSGRYEVTAPAPLPRCAGFLDPMEAPWTRDLVLDCGRWTAYLNNFIGGGDSTAVAPAVARRMGARCIIATHMPLFGPGHAATQLELLGPDGEPPLMYVRTLAAHAEDGQWSWHVSGREQPFERPQRYLSRRVRDRLDRGLLVEYLAALAIHVDDPAFFGEGIGVHQQVTWPVRREWVAEWRRDNS